MSRIAKSPITLPSGVEVKIDGSNVSVKGSKGSLSKSLNEMVAITLEDGVVSVAPKGNQKDAWAKQELQDQLLIIWSKVYLKVSRKNYC